MSEQKIYKFNAEGGMLIKDKYRVMDAVILDSCVSPIQLDFIPPLDWGNHSTYPFLRDFEPLRGKLPSPLAQQGHFVSELMSQKALNTFEPLFDSNTQIVPAVYDKKHHYYFVEPHRICRTSSETARERAARTDGAIPYFQIWHENIFEGCFVNQSFFDLMKKNELRGALIFPVWDLETNKEMY